MKSPSLLRSEWIYSRIRTLPWPKYSFDIPSWQAHRGYWKSGQAQNSIGSLREARSIGARMVEFDVRLTLDRVPVLFHDESFKTSSGRTLKIDELSLSSLSDHFPVTTLEEVLKDNQVPDFLNIEIKSEKILDEPLERSVTELISKVERRSSRDLSGRLLFSSFNPVSISKLASLAPQIPRAFLASPDADEIYLSEMWMSLVKNFHLLHLDQAMITEERMKLWNKNEVMVAAWTVNDRTEMKKLLSWGVVSIISDEVPPQEILELV